MIRRVALSCLDWQVNSAYGIRTLQAVLGLPVTGVPAHATFNELSSWLNAGKEDQLLHNYFDRRENLYIQWAYGSQRKFFQGWMNRAETLRHYLRVP